MHFSQSGQCGKYTKVALLLTLTPAPLLLLLRPNRASPRPFTPPATEFSPTAGLQLQTVEAVVVGRMGKTMVNVG